MLQCSTHIFGVNPFRRTSAVRGGEPAAGETYPQLPCSLTIVLPLSNAVRINVTLIPIVLFLNALNRGDDLDAQYAKAVLTKRDAPIVGIAIHP